MGVPEQTQAEKEAAEISGGDQPSPETSPKPQEARHPCRVRVPHPVFLLT